jgi:hypothetical protein
MKRIKTLLWQHSVIALLCCCAAVVPVAETGCTTAQKLQVVTDIKVFLPAVTNIADAVCAFLPAAPVCVGGVTAVTSSAGILDEALINYYTALSQGAVPPSVLQALSQAITTFESNAANILDAVRLLNPLEQKNIEGLLGAAQLLFAAAETLFPSAAVPAGALKFTRYAQPQFDIKAWTAEYNKKVDAANKTMPRSVTLRKVHINGLFVRLGTFGVKK